jgi:hypothetical protein
VKTIVKVERKVAKMKIQTVINDIVVKERIRDVVKIRKEKAARMIVSKRI